MNNGSPKYFRSDGPAGAGHPKGKGRRCDRGPVAAVCGRFGGLKMVGNALLGRRDEDDFYYVMVVYRRWGADNRIASRRV